MRSEREGRQVGKPMSERTWVVKSSRAKEVDLEHAAREHAKARQGQLNLRILQSLGNEIKENALAFMRQSLVMYEQRARSVHHVRLKPKKGSDSLVVGHQWRYAGLSLFLLSSDLLRMGNIERMM